MRANLVKQPRPISQDHRHRVAVLLRVAGAVGRPGEDALRHPAIGRRQLVEPKREVAQDERRSTRRWLPDTGVPSRYLSRVEQRQRTQQRVVRGVDATARKRAAVGCYTSQLKGLGDLVRDAYLPERYWSMIRS